MFFNDEDPTADGSEATTPVVPTEEEATAEEAAPVADEAQAEM